jgi:large conductance mechanosensitive channel
MGFIKDFKDFAIKGNVVDLAVAVIIGGAFGKIVSSFVKDIVMPPIGLLLGGVKFTDLAVVLKEGVTNAAGEVIEAPVLWTYGIFVQNVVDFLIIALVIFIAVRLISNLKKKEEVAPTPPPPALSKSEILLQEIRDLLRSK